MMDENTYPKAKGRGVHVANKKKKNSLRSHFYRYSHKVEVNK